MAPLTRVALIALAQCLRSPLQARCPPFIRLPAGAMVEARGADCFRPPTAIYTAPPRLVARMALARYSRWLPPGRSPPWFSLMVTTAQILRPRSCRELMGIRSEEH